MSERLYWGEGGEYGPYHAQVDGWPNAGEVQRDYRLKQNMSAEEAAKRYTAALRQLESQKQGSVKFREITSSWIVNMENENRIPGDITRRRLLADLFGIPYALFGLAPLEQILLKPTMTTQTPFSSPPASPLTRDIAGEIAQKEKDIRLFWQLHYTSTAHHVLPDIAEAIVSLEALELESKGQLQEHVYMLLNSYYQLGAEITRDQGAFASSYIYANHAVRVTKNISREHMIAQAQHRRGYTSLVWGIFGDADATGAFRRDVDKISAAINDFEQALSFAPPQLKGFVRLALSRAYGYLQRSQTDVSMALNLIEQAGNTVGVGLLDEPNTPMTSFNKGMYHLNSAIALTALGRPGKAIEELESLEHLHGDRGIGRNQTRRHAWIDILYAQASLGTREYYEATRRATNALMICKDIHSSNNIAIVNDIHSQLLKSPYKGHRDVADLGKMLTNYYHSQEE